MNRKALALVCAACVPCVVAARSFVASFDSSLGTFNDVMSVLNSGGEVRAVFDYHKCQLLAEDGTSDFGPEAIGGMALSTWEYFGVNVVGNAKAYVSASEHKLVGRKRADGTFVHVYNYVKMKIFDDNTVEINAQYLSPTTFEVKMDETFRCEVSTSRSAAKGATFFSR